MEQERGSNEQHQEAQRGPVELLPELNGNHKAEQPDQQLGRLRHFLQGWNWDRFIQLGILVAVVVYAYLTYGLWNTTEEGVHTGQRAYLLIENVRLRGKLDNCTDRPKYGEMNVTLAPGTPMWLQWDVKNAGLTPALNIRQRFKFYIDDGNKPPGAGGGEPFGGTRVALGPGECDSSPDAPWMWLDRRHGGDLPPRIWTVDDAKSISPEGGKRLWVVVSIDYDTAFKGVTGFSTFCGYYDNSLFSSCNNMVK